MRSFFNRLIFLGLFLFFSSVSFGQSKFAFSATVAPFFGHTKTTALIPLDNGNGTYTYQIWTSKYSPKGFWIGLNGRYSFSQKWSASTGLWFSQRLKLSTPRSWSHNFSIPVLVNLQTSEKKLSPYFSAGALWNFETTSRANIPDFGTSHFQIRSS